MLDEASTALWTMTEKAGRPPLQERSVAESRALAGAAVGMLDPGPPMAREFDATIPGADGDDAGVGARVLVPPAPTRGIVVYFHGGGWVLGTVEQFIPIGRQLAHHTGCTVVLVDYRLAPEHPFPAALQDAESAAAWVTTHRAELGGADDCPVVLAGDSAGGNLAAVVANRHRARTPDTAFAAQVLVYPVTDADLSRPSYVDPANRLILTVEGMGWFWDHYLGEPAKREDPDASPLRTVDLTGVAPAIVVTAEHDVLRDEGEAYARRLDEVGALIASQRFEGQMHGFFSMPGLLPGSTAAVEFVAHHLDEVLTAHRATDTSVPPTSERSAS